MAFSSAAGERLLLRGGRIVSMDAGVGDLVGDVLLEGGRIVAIGSALEAEGADTVDVTGDVVMPGFVDSHRHLWEAPLRGRAADASLGAYFGWLLGQVAPALSANGLAISTRLAAAEALDAGVTTVLDWANATNSPDHADVSIDELEESGIRAVFAHGNAKDADDVRRHRERLDDGGLVTLALSLDGPEFGSVEATVADIALGRELGLVSSMHVGCGMAGQAAGVSALAAQGLLGPDLNFVHCNTISDREVDLLVEAGCGISITPLVECLMGHGTPAFSRFLRAGGDPSLGIDVAVASDPGLFIEMRTALALARMTSNQEVLDGGEDVTDVSPRARQVLHAATLAGARAIGLDDRVGSLKVGKRADITILDGSALPHDAEDLVGAIVTTANPSDVRSVLVDGRWVKRDGRLLGHDLPALRREAAQVTAAV